MSQKLNAEALAAKRFEVIAPKPSFSNALTDEHLLALAQEAQRTGYAAAIREVAQPLADELNELMEVLEEIALDPHGAPTAQEDASAILAKYPRS